jgi:hypothetical protein
LNYYKPDFLTQLFAHHCPNADGVFYFDTDIVLARPWGFFESWLAHGIALCEDLPHCHFSSDHPVRCAWGDLIRRIGYTVARDCDRYVNSGFIGIPRAQRSFLATWGAINGAVERADGLRLRRRAFMVGDLAADGRFIVPPDIADLLRATFMEDQDALNMAIMATQQPLSVMGPDAMGFDASWNFAMAHAVGPDKPWNTSFVLHAARCGIAPSRAAREWWKHAAGPLPAASGREIAAARLRMAAATIVARLVSA